MVERPLSVQGQRVIEAVGAGRRLRRRLGGWAAGPLVAPDRLVSELERAGMVRRAGEGLVLGDAGAAWCRRRDGGASRLLAERALPQDSEALTKPGPARPRSVTVNLAESPLGWIKARGLVSDRQFEAAERLRGDWTVAGLAPRVTMRWGAAPRSAHAPRRARCARPDAGADRGRTADGGGARRGQQGVARQAVADRLCRRGDGGRRARAGLASALRMGGFTPALDRLADFYGLP